MDLKLQGKLAVVSGSTSGIGRSIAQSLLAEGAKVVVNGRSEESVFKALKTLGGDTHGIVAHVATAEGCDKLLEEARKLCSIEILINNAGIFEPKPLRRDQRRRLATVL